MNVDFALAIGGAILAAMLALGVAIRSERSLVRWVFVAGMLLLAAESVFSAMSDDAVLPGEVVRWEASKLVTMSFLPGVWLFFSLSYSRGNARESLAKSRFLVAAAVLLPVGLAVLFRANLIASILRVATADHWNLGLSSYGIALNFLVLIGAVLVLMNLERTFRAAVGTMRWRIKFMILGLGVLFAVRAYTSTQVLLFRGVDLSLQSVDSGALLVACLLILRALARTGQFDVKVYPSRSVLHNSLTVLLAGIYLLIVGVFAKVVTFLGGDEAFTLKAFLVLILLVVLSVLLLSDRVRLYTRRFVSRHFQRPLYDYRTVWGAFTEGTAVRVEPVDFSRAVVKLVADLFQILSVSIWLVDDKQQKVTFAASTSLSETAGSDLRPQGADAIEVIRALRDHPDPMDINTAKENWAAVLRRCHPDEFHKGGSRAAVPVISGGEVLGLMTLGDRVGGVPFSQQDFDLLKCVGGQVAAGLLNIRLSQRLLQAKELEAFQTMSAFFVHDLKNTASTLNLMLRNLPVHFDDPAFREDALRGISNTVGHINHLLGRLSLLRHELKSQPVESDLNAVVLKALAGWQQASNVAVVRDLRSLPKVFLDQEQMLKVVTNLVLNATEAMSGTGRILIETSQLNGCAVLTVADNGCGMSPDFLNRSLFRPFQTTKKNGLGIGMFQSRMIVESHGGRIEVESEQGKGTTFRVWLPLPQQNA